MKPNIVRNITRFANFSSLLKSDECCFLFTNCFARQFGHVSCVQPEISNHEFNCSTSSNLGVFALQCLQCTWCFIINNNFVFLYMKIVKQESFESLSQLTGKIVNFTSDCEMFKNFNVVGRVLSVQIGHENETIFEINTHPTNKTIKIGSNMKNLKYEVMSR